MPPRACSRTARFGSLCRKESGLGAGEIDWIAFNGYHAAYPMTRDELMHEYTGTIAMVGTKVA
jgi:hypothetical protein